MLQPFSFFSITICGLLPSVTHMDLPQPFGLKQLKTVLEVGVFACKRGPPSQYPGMTNIFAWLASHETETWMQWECVNDDVMPHALAVENTNWHSPHLVGHRVDI